MVIFAAQKDRIGKAIENPLPRSKNVEFINSLAMQCLQEAVAAHGKPGMIEQSATLTMQHGPETQGTPGLPSMQALHIGKDIGAGQRLIIILIGKKANTLGQIRGETVQIAAHGIGVPAFG